MKFDLGDVPAWAALLASVGAIYVATRANRHARDSAAASKDSAVSARRSADASERQAQAAEQALAPSSPQVRWRITRGQGRESYVLRNVGTATATAVQVDLTCLPTHTVLDLGDHVFRPGQAITFWIILAASDDDVQQLWLTWDGQPEAVPVPMP
ncbi:hypothetical protein [Micromonospora palomenae]|uniref:hypothetical protein n=1 Tax=Micromonospora palomenae TaxID=1461247 RepID=UPI0012B9AEF8|nr:hypothetical protein [Micromonospora palomenae]